jgi:hypothetical protein
MARLVLYALSGSEYVAATLAGLQSRKLAHAIVFVNMDEKKRQNELPSGGRFVPEITYEDASRGGYAGALRRCCSPPLTDQLAEQTQWRLVE